MLIDDRLEVNPVTLCAVSDVWQGPGWWLAPDGKWYPADGGPDVVAPVDTAIPEATIPVTAISEPTIPEPTIPEPPILEPTVQKAAIPITDEPADLEPPRWDTPVVDIPIVDTPDVDTSIVDNPVVDTPTSGSGGWQAAEPELAEDDANSEDGWTSGFTGEIPEVDAPDAGSPVAEDAVPTASVLAPPPSTADSDQATGSGTLDPIHRDEAWRKPTADGPPVEGTSTRRGAPTVVDLAVPQPGGDETTDDEKQGVSPLFMAIGAAAALLLLAVAINFFFFDDDDNTDVSTDPAPSTSAAPTTTAESTDTSETSVDATTTTVETTTSSTSVTADSVEISVFDLQAGDCIESEIGTGQVQKLIKVDCDVAHEFEVYREALVDKTIETYDVDAIEAQAQQLCRRSLARLIPDGDDRDLMYKWFQPTEQSWNQAGNPDRVITCLVFDEGEKLVGTVG